MFYAKNLFDLNSNLPRKRRTINISPPLGFEIGMADPEEAYLPHEPGRFPTRKYVDIFLERNQLNVM